MAAAHTGHAILVSTQQSAFDVLIVEQRLADGHARAVVERLQEWNPNVRTLRLCDAGTSGPTALVRPFTADSLLKKLEALARRTVDYSPPGLGVFGILKTESSSGTLNSAFSIVNSVTGVPLTVCLILNGIFRPLTSR